MQRFRKDRCFLSDGVPEVVSEVPVVQVVNEVGVEGAVAGVVLQGGQGRVAERGEKACCHTQTMKVVNIN